MSGFSVETAFGKEATTNYCAGSLVNNTMFEAAYTQQTMARARGGGGGEQSID